MRNLQIIQENDSESLLILSIEDYIYMIYILEE